jgi:uncharacterized membrane protein
MRSSWALERFNMHSARSGQLLFAIGCVALGALTVVWDGFYREWLPFANTVSRFGSLAELCGILLLLGGAGLFSQRTARFAAFALTLFWLAVLFAKVPMLFAHPLVEEAWEDFSESLIFVAGSWSLFSLASPRAHGQSSSRLQAVGRLLFALALPAIGLSHFFYLHLTAPLIPAWLPAHRALAYGTGVAHIAAGIGLLFGIFPRLAATLEALMVSLFTLLVWVPMVATFYASRSDWSEICISTLISGSAWAVAATLRHRPWFEMSTLRGFRDVPWRRSRAPRRRG